jgi:hypothetical protein
MTCFSREYGGEDGVKYVQGMIGVGIPLFYVLTEINAYYCYCQLITRCIPTYNQNECCGAYAATSIIDQIIVNHYDQLIPMFPVKIYGLLARNWAFQFSLTCCSSFEPIEEVLLLWDFFILNGFFFTPLCVLAQIILNYDELKVLGPGDFRKRIEKGFTIDASKTITVAVDIFENLSSKMKFVVRNHTEDLELAEMWMKTNCLETAQENLKKIKK